MKRQRTGTHTHTTSIIENLLIADLDSHTKQTNLDQLDKIMSITEKYAEALGVGSVDNCVTNAEREALLD